MGHKSRLVKVFPVDTFDTLTMNCIGFPGAFSTRIGFPGVLVHAPPRR